MAQSVLHDRAVDYPIKIARYPHGATVANPSQLQGVVMGRLVAAQRTCSRLDLFQDAVSGIFTHSFARGFKRRMLHSTWTRFLVQYWDASSVSIKELRRWFHMQWKKIVKGHQRNAFPYGVRQRVAEGQKRTGHGTSSSRLQALLAACTPEEVPRLQVLAACAPLPQYQVEGTSPTLLKDESL